MKHRLLAAFFISLLLALIILPIFSEKIAFAASSCPSSPIPNPQKPIAIAVCLTNGGNVVSNPSGYKVTVKNSFNGSSHTYQTTYSSSDQVYFTTATILVFEGNINATACSGTTLDPYNLTLTATKGSSTYEDSIDGSSLCGNVNADFAYVESLPVTNATSSSQTGGINIAKSCVTYTAQDGSTQPFNGSSNQSADGTPATATITGPNNKTYTSGFTSGGCLSNTLLENSMPVGTYKIVADYTPGNTSHGDTPSQTFTGTFTINAGKQAIASGKATPSGSATTITNTGNNNDNGTTVPSLSCSAGFNPLNWLICGVVTGLVGIIGDVDNLITGLLSVGSGNGSAEPSAIFCSSNTLPNDQVACNDYYSAWSQFRDIALGLLVLIGLIIIITEAMGMEVVDAYTLRKVLPRLVFATIAITLSWEIMRYFVEFTNALGFGIRYLIYQPFVNLSNHADLGGGGGIAISLATSAAITAMGIFGLLSFVATAALAVFVAFIVLVIRQLVIIMLIILAPIAILAYILPNTQNVYKIWWDSFSRALLMFPLIVGLIAIGRVFAAVTLTQDNSSAISNIIAFAAYFAPYFIIPFTFRLAGGAMRNIGGAVHNANRGLYSSLGKYRSTQVQKNMELAQSNRRFNPNKGLIGGVNRRLNTTLSNITSPEAAAKIYGGAAINKLGNRFGVQSSLGRGIINQIDQTKFEHSQKLGEKLNGLGFNDRTLRTLMKMDDFSAGNIRRTAQKMMDDPNSDSNDRLAAGQLLSNASFLGQSLYSDPDMGRADIRAAAGLAVTAQGFSDTNEVADVANRMGGVNNGLASMLVTQSQLNGQRAGRLDMKAGYGIQVGENGNFFGTGLKSDKNGGVIQPSSREERDRLAAHQIRRLKTTGQSEIQAAKAGSIDAMAPGFEQLLSGQGTFNYTDERGQVQQLQVGEGEAERVAAMLGTASADYSGTSPATIQSINKIMDNVKARGPVTPQAQKILAAFDRGKRESYDPASRNPQQPEPGADQGQGGGTPPA